MLAGSPIASANGSPAITTAEIDFPGNYSFTVFAQDDKGDTSWTTQSVALLTYPLLDLIVGGFQNNGVFKICMLGEPSQNYQVLVSSNLSTTNWVSLGVLESTNGIWRFSDTGATNQARRFYRAERLP